MKDFIKNNAWVAMVLVFMLMVAIMLRIVDRPEEVDAKEIKPTPDNIALEMYYDDLENLALATMAECGHQDDECIRATADVMINRYADPEFPDTFYGVFSQPGQYETFRLYSTINPTDRVYTICREQLEYFEKNGKTQHPGAFYFRTKHYHTFGTPMFQAGAHYFSGR